MQREAKGERGGVLLGVDVGGTFTDAFLVSKEGLFTAKVLTTTDDQSDGVMAAVALTLDRAAGEPADVERFAHGMTVATNALLEERGARTALLATAGFTDVIEIGRQARRELYRLCQSHPAPLVAPELRFPVNERMGPDGVVRPLDQESLAEALDRLEQSEVEAVAISLLHSYADPSHEQAVAAAVAERLPQTHVSASHDVLGVFREYERTSTTVIDAYLSPLLRAYLERLAVRAREAGLPEPEIMQSSGGVMSWTNAGRHAAWTVLSGPAAGAVGAAHIGLLAGEENVLSFDMGGTSCDVAVVDSGRVRQTMDRTIAGRVLQLPLVDVHTVGAGGGSIGWVDPGGALRVGPRSAGAKPGPACYGAGGEDATVTDANLVLGYLDPETRLPDGLTLDVEAAERALANLGKSAGLTVRETAEGIVRVVDEEMLAALRVVSVERGVDPRRYCIVAFGGAGPMHSARIAEHLGVERVLCPRPAGVLSALGLVASDRRRDFAKSVFLRGSDLTAEHIDDASERLVQSAREEVPGGELRISYDLRYRGQAFELEIDAPEGNDPTALRERFEEAHRERYGYSDAESELELVNIRVAAVLAGASPELEAFEPARPARTASERRPASFGGEWIEASVLRRELAPGEEIEGPAICELPESTIVVPPGWQGTVRTDGTLVLERES